MAVYDFFCPQFLPAIAFFVKLFNRQWYFLMHNSGIAFFALVIIADEHRNKLLLHKHRRQKHEPNRVKKRKEWKYDWIFVFHTAIIMKNLFVLIKKKNRAHFFAHMAQLAVSICKVERGQTFSCIQNEMLAKYGHS